MRQYRELLKHVMNNGVTSEDRTGTGTLSVFGYQCRFDLSEGFPLLPMKETKLDNILIELQWFLQGDTNIRYLLENGCNIWTDWPLARYRTETGDDKMTRNGFIERILHDDAFALKWGDCGPIYSHQWRNFFGADQIVDLERQLARNPDSRRMIVSAWNPAQLTQMALPPCHAMWQCYVRHGKLSMQLYQRSADVGLGVPYNWASYSALLLALCAVHGLEPGEFIWTGGDVHIYRNHLDKLRLVYEREPRPLPTLTVTPKEGCTSVLDLDLDDYTLSGYNPHPFVYLPVAV